MSTRFPRVALAATVMLFHVAGVSLAQSKPAAPASSQTQAHAGHGGNQEKPKPAPTTQQDHSAHQKPAEQKQYPAGIPPITDEDRAAAFPELNGQHTVHDDAVHYYVLFDQLEAQDGADGDFGGRPVYRRPVCEPSYH